MAKKIIIGIVGVVGSVVLLSVLVGVMLDREMVLETEQRVQTDPAKFFPFLTTVDGMRAWWTVAGKQTGAPDALLVQKKAGPDEGVGLELTFGTSGGKVAETWVIREVSAPMKVVYDVDFAGMMNTKRTLMFTPAADGGYDARWHEVADIGNPLVRVLMRMSDFKAAIENRNVALRALEVAASATPR